MVGTDTEKIAKHVKDWYPRSNNQKDILGYGNTSTIIKEKILEELE